MFAIRPGGQHGPSRFGIEKRVSGPSCWQVRALLLPTCKAPGTEDEQRPLERRG